MSLEQRFLSSFVSFFFRLFRGGRKGVKVTELTHVRGGGGGCWAGRLVVPEGGGGVAVGPSDKATTPHPPEIPNPGVKNEANLRLV